MSAPTEPPPAAVVEPTPDTRLAQLADAYTSAKAAADEADAHLKTITDAIKIELITAAPGSNRIDLKSPSLAAPLRMQSRTSWKLDTARLKAEDPETYVRYARQSSYWELRAVSGRSS